MVFNKYVLRSSRGCQDADSDYRKVEGIRDGDDPELKKRGLMDKVRGVCDVLSDRIPQQHKDTVTDHFNRGNYFLGEEYFPG